MPGWGMESMGSVGGRDPGLPGDRGRKYLPMWESKVSAAESAMRESGRAKKKANARAKAMRAKKTRRRQRAMR